MYEVKKNSFDIGIDDLSFTSYNKPKCEIIRNLDDTPQYIKELQLKIWLSKSPEERLKQFMEDNASLFQFWRMAQKSNDKASDSNDES